MLDDLKKLLKTSDIDANFVNDNHELLQFNVHDLIYLIRYRKDIDPTYAVISLPNVLEMQQNENERLLAEIQNINSMFKVGKIVCIDNYLWINAETFFLDIDNLQFFVLRSINLLREIYMQLKSYITENINDK